MKTITLAVRRALAATACVLPLAAFATDGYFSHGYGIKAQGHGRRPAAASPQDAFGGANNPASHGLRRQPPGRRRRPGSARAARCSATGSGGGMLDFSVDSDSTLFAIPEFGYNTMYSNDRSPAA